VAVREHTKLTILAKAVALHPATLGQAFKYNRDRATAPGGPGETWTDHITTLKVTAVNSQDDQDQAPLSRSAAAVSVKTRLGGARNDSQELAYVKKQLEQVTHERDELRKAATNKATTNKPRTSTTPTSEYYCFICGYYSADHPQAHNTKGHANNERKKELTTNQVAAKGHALCDGATGNSRRNYTRASP